MHSVNVRKAGDLFFNKVNEETSLHVLSKLKNQLKRLILNWTKFQFQSIKHPRITHLYDIYQFYVLYAAINFPKIRTSKQSLCLFQCFRKSIKYETLVLTWHRMKFFSEELYDHLVLNSTVVLFFGFIDTLQ